MTSAKMIRLPAVYMGRNKLCLIALLLMGVLLFCAIVSSETSFAVVWPVIVASILILVFLHVFLECMDSKVDGEEEEEEIILLASVASGKVVPVIYGKSLDSQCQGHSELGVSRQKKDYGATVVIEDSGR